MKILRRPTDGHLPAGPAPGYIGSVPNRLPALAIRLHKERFAPMLTTLAFLAALPLAPAQQGGLSLTHDRLTYGLLGPTRADSKVLPDDDVVLHFDIENVTVDKDGKVKYSSGLEVADPSGKVIFMQPAREAEIFNTLGGTTVPAYALLHVGGDQMPGDYTLKVTVNDLQSKKSATLTKKVTVLPKAFGLIRILTTSDIDAKHPAGVLSVGESLYINAFVTGFTRNAATKQPNLEVTMVIKDEAGKPTLPNPFVDTIAKDVPATLQLIPLQFLISLNRAGKFTAELTVNDKDANKKVTQTVPFTVVPGR
jgi:hypothetical protein